MSGGHDNHGHDDHKNESPTEKTKKGFDWLGKVFWGLFLGGLALLIAFFIWRSFFHENDSGPRQQGDRPVAAAPAASEPVGFCVDIPNQVVTAPVNGWSDAILVPAGCTIYRDATNIRTQCRNDGEREWRNADASGACIGDMERHQSKVGEPVTQTVYFRPG
jgi:hypothetical protein